MSTEQEKRIRAKIIEHIVQEDYADENVDVVDLAYEELMRDDSRSDAAIAHAVAMLIRFP